MEVEKQSAKVYVWVAIMLWHGGLTGLFLQTSIYCRLQSV